MQSDSSSPSSCCAFFLSFPLTSSDETALIRTVGCMPYHEGDSQASNLTADPSEEAEVPPSCLALNPLPPEVQGPQSLEMREHRHAVSPRDFRSLHIGTSGPSEDGSQVLNGCLISSSRQRQCIKCWDSLASESYP
eukprot:scaffold155158_cov37-Prasinocladus_malaysianus.AAC.1